MEEIMKFCESYFMEEFIQVYYLIDNRQTSIWPERNVVLHENNSTNCLEGTITKKGTYGQMMMWMMSR